MGLGDGCKMLKRRRIPSFLLGNCKMGDERLRFKRKMSCGCYLRGSWRSCGTRAHILALGFG